MLGQAGDPQGGCSSHPGGSGLVQLLLEFLARQGGSCVHPVQEVALAALSILPPRHDRGRGEVFLGWGHTEAGSHFVAGLVIL